MIVQNNLPHWVDRTVEISLEYGRLTALEELSLQAWINGFSQEYTPEFEELNSQGIDAQIYAGAGSLILKVRSSESNQVATLEWLVKKLKSYVYTPEALAQFVEDMQKSLRNREFGFPANAATSLSSTLFSPRGLSAPQFETALPQLTLDMVQKAVRSDSLQQARKRLFFGGAFFESEVSATKVLAQTLAPQNLKNPGPLVGDRFAVRGENLTFVEPWLFPSSEGIGTTRLPKGAVNLLLAECYVRRDQVGVIAFRGRSAEVLLPPTRSLVRAKRSLAALPGGGGTPLAAGLQAALAMAAQVRRAGAVPVVVLLTDGRANVALDGAPGRARAEDDALQVGRQLRAAGLTTLVVDTSPQPSPAARRLAQAMAAPYRTLPHAGAVELSAAVRSLPRAPA